MTRSRDARESEGKAESKLAYLSSEAAVIAATEALNQTVRLFSAYLAEDKCQWVIANDYHPELKTPIINESATSLLRPMTELSFNIQPDQFTVTDNELFKLLAIKWRIPFHGFTLTNSKIRCCVLSVDDVELLLKIPTLCAPYTLAEAPETMTQPSHAVSSEPVACFPKKQFLLKLKSEVFLGKWNNKGYGFYSYHVPKQIEKMRELLRSITEQSDYDDCILSFEAINKLFEHHQAKRGRDAEVEKLYSHIISEMATIIAESKLTSSMNGSPYKKK